MIQQLHQETKSFIYESREERDGHVLEMIRDGWEVGSQVKKLKANISILDAKPEDRDWYAIFTKFHSKEVF